MHAVKWSETYIKSSAVKCLRVWFVCACVVCMCAFSRMSVHVVRWSGVKCASSEVREVCACVVSGVCVRV